MTEIEDLKERIALKKEIIKEIRINTENTIEELEAHIRVLEREVEREANKKEGK